MTVRNTCCIYILHEREAILKETRIFVFMSRFFPYMKPHQRVFASTVSLLVALCLTERQSNSWAGVLVERAPSHCVGDSCLTERQSASWAGVRVRVERASSHCFGYSCLTSIQWCYSLVPYTINLHSKRHLVLFSCSLPNIPYII